MHAILKLRCAVFRHRSGSLNFVVYVNQEFIYCRISYREYAVIRLTFYEYLVKYWFVLELSGMLPSFEVAFEVPSYAGRNVFVFRVPRNVAEYFINTGVFLVISK